MIGRIRNIVLDARRPRELADFWVGVLGGRVVAEDDTWIAVVDGAGRRIAFQLSPGHEPPQFPDERGSQQIHLDLDVDDIDEAERRVVALGATRVTEPHEETDFRVFLDPAGHPFCLIVPQG
jgi:catechol 2,3-dioxygenase-like lactoylglutathione lyase family enzyme